MSKPDRRSPQVRRSLRADVRNPLLLLPAAAGIASLDPDCRIALDGLLHDISADARARAEKCWKQHKAPMAAYWKAVAVYAAHARRLTRLAPPRETGLVPIEWAACSPGDSEICDRCHATLETYAGSCAVLSKACPVFLRIERAIEEGNL